MIGFADIMLAGQHGELTERQEDYLNRIFKAGTHLLSMITDLIDLAKLDLGALSLINEPSDVFGICKEASEMLQPQLDAKEHKLQLKCPPDLDEMEIDPRRLKQILINLLGNAIKFTPDGGTITLSVSASDQLIIKVIDTGIGISKADQKRIFQDFVQLDSALHRHHEGTGIGLTLTRRLVELMEGTLTLESAPKKGSTFTVSLPVRLLPPADEATDAKEREKAQSEADVDSSGADSKAADGEPLDPNPDTTPDADLESTEEDVSEPGRKAAP